jgi:signal transduction histidine kinase
LATAIVVRPNVPSGLALDWRKWYIGGVRGSPLPAVIARVKVRAAERAAFGERPLTFSDAVRPITTTPVLLDDRLVGLVLVLVLPSRLTGIPRELARFLSLPSTIVLIVTTVVVALVVFNPARRRLSALEDAAHRLGEGDLSSRAPQAGGDEIARVAAAFNRMAGELEARDAALRTSDALRRQMMADVSHELKTPLTAMRGYIETLRMPEVALEAERRDRYFESIDRETRRLERIVKDLLDLARYEHGGVVLQRRVFDIERLLENVAGRHEREAQRKGVAIRIHVDPLADQVVADPDRIEQAIDNLVSNALPRWTGQNRPFVDTSKPAISGERDRGRIEFYRTPSPVCKSVWTFVRQLRGPHFSTCA